MLRSSLALSLFLFLFACQTTQLPTDELALAESAAHIHYTPSDMKKMQWLAGAWKGEEKGRSVRQLFQFHGNASLEILCADTDNNWSSCAFTWHDGRFYFGQYRQWVVTWIGDKDVRFDPVRPGLESMTWTRLSDQKWHKVVHTATGDETVVMQRTDEMQP